MQEGRCAQCGAARTGIDDKNRLASNGSGQYPGRNAKEE